MPSIQPEPKPNSLSADEARQLFAQLAAVSETALPLAEGLRSAAAEMPHDRLRATMRQLAERFERGEELESVLGELLQHGDPELRGVIVAALGSGKLADVLGHYVEQDRVRRELWGEIRGALAYPLLLLSMCLGLVVVFSIYVMRDIGENILLLYWGWPDSSTMARINLIQWWSNEGVYQFLGGLGIVVIMIVVARLVVGPARWQRCKTYLPLLGPLYRWISLFEWSRMTGLLLGYQVPLAQAISWAAAGSSSADVSQFGARLAAGVEQGRSLSSLLESRRSTSGTLAMMVQWGERADALPGALSAAADYFEDRARLRIALLRATLPPVVFVFVAFVGVLMFGVLFSAFWMSVVQMASWT